MGFSLPMNAFDIRRLVLASASPRRRELVALLDLSLPVLVFSTDVDETAPSDWTPVDTAMRLALRKAQAAIPLIGAETADRAVIIGADTIVVLGDEIMGKPQSEEAAVSMLAKLQGRRHSVCTGVACIAPMPAVGASAAKDPGSRSIGSGNAAAAGGAPAFIERGGSPASAAAGTPFYSTKHAGFSLLEFPDGERGCDLYAAVGYSVADVQFKPLGYAEIERYVKTGEPMDKAGAYGLQGKGAALIEHIEGDHNGIIGFPVSLVADMLKPFGLNAY